VCATPAVVEDLVGRRAHLMIVATSIQVDG